MTFDQCPFKIDWRSECGKSSKWLTSGASAAFSTAVAAAAFSAAAAPPVVVSSREVLWQEQKSAGIRLGPQEKEVSE